MANFDLSGLSREQIIQLQTTLSPKWTKYIPITPTPKQTAALLMDNVKEMLYGGAAGGGKALDVNTPILTANRGWQTMGSLEVGDLVFSQDGKSYPVIAKSPVYLEHECYNVTFDDGNSLVADAEHLWHIDEWRNRHCERVMTTAELATEYCRLNRSAAAIYVRQPLEMPEQQLPCHPYAFGLWLGDGDKRHGNLACQDPEIYENLEQLGYDVYKTDGDYDTVWKSSRLRAELRSMGYTIQGAPPKPKSIPEQYMRASAAQRLQLLWGLMDTDGNASTDRGYCSICMVDKELMLQIEELVRSLGIKVTLRESVATCSQTGAQRPKYNLKWSTAVRMFTLPYKYELQNKGPFRGPQRKHYIKSIEKVASRPVQCISVDSPKHVYLAGRALIPTHNSVFLLAAALQYVDCPGYSAILFRKTFADLMLPGALIPMSKEWLAPFIASGEVHWADKDKKYTFKESGATLSFGYLENNQDHLRYQGAEFSFVGIDECTHIMPESYRYMFSRLRKKKIYDFPLRFRASANPGGQYGDYYYERFFVDNLDANGKPKRFFLPSGLKDNPHIDADAYRESLAELDPITRAQLENGDWEIRPSGDLFDKTWLIPINALDIPKGVRWVRFWDLAAVDPRYRKNKHNKQAPDWTVGFKLGMLNGCYYIGDILKVQKAPHDLEELIYNTAVADGYSCAIRMEEEGGSSGIANTERYARNILQGFDFAGVKPVVSKIERARPVAAACQAGSVFISSHCRNLTDFYAQLDAFPNGSNDDMVDGFSGAFSYFRPKIGHFDPPTITRAGNRVVDRGEPRVAVRSSGSGSYWHKSMSGR